MPGVWMLSHGRGYSLLVTAALIALMWVPALNMAALLVLIIIGAKEPDRGSYEPQ